MREPMRQPTYLLERNRAFLLFVSPFFFPPYLSSPALRNCSLTPASVRQRGTGTRIGSFRSLGVSRRREKKKQRQGRVKITEEEGETQRGGSRTCVRLKPEADTGRGGRMGETVTAGLKRWRTKSEGGDEGFGRCDGTTAHKSSA